MGIALEAAHFGDFDVVSDVEEAFDDIYKPDLIERYEKLTDNYQLNRAESKALAAAVDSLGHGKNPVDVYLAMPIHSTKGIEIFKRAVTQNYSHNPNISAGFGMGQGAYTHFFNPEVSYEGVSPGAYKDPIFERAGKAFAENIDMWVTYVQEEAEHSQEHHRANMSPGIALRLLGFATEALRDYNFKKAYKACALLKPDEPNTPEDEMGEEARDLLSSLYKSIHASELDADHLDWLLDPLEDDYSFKDMIEIAGEIGDTKYMRVFAGIAEAASYHQIMAPYKEGAQQYTQLLKRGYGLHALFTDVEAYLRENDIVSSFTTYEGVGGSLSIDDCIAKYDALQFSDGFSTLDTAVVQARLLGIGNAAAKNYDLGTLLLVASALDGDNVHDLAAQLYNRVQKTEYEAEKINTLETAINDYKSTATDRDRDLVALYDACGELDADEQDNIFAGALQHVHGSMAKAYHDGVNAFMDDSKADPEPYGLIYLGELEEEIIDNTHNPFKLIGAFFASKGLHDDPVHGSFYEKMTEALSQAIEKYTPFAAPPVE
ncbi:hypothetical protein HZB01_00985 [Candidatus Woesearchaeota archaeon]|nr:hypothetical protein [Candidatus Woesearchaeota archaeon]